MFEIKGNQVAQLNDEDLRSLVVRLAEAELARNDLPISSVTAGGDQNAPDGGVDVRVSLESCVSHLDFIPRHITGFQVKKPDMPPGEIAREMRPNGNLRQSILDLARANGSYVIVSAQGSTADVAFQRRLQAMRESITSLLPGENLHVDFYDRDRLARWINQYPGVVLWLRDRLGEPLAGWQPYSSWAYGDSPGSLYVIDEHARILDYQHKENVTIEQGISAMRHVLAKPKGIVRLVGTSGVGKTRLVQALFDRRLAGISLDQSLAVYTDEGAEPEPSPREMITRLGSAGTRAIMVVDNCKPSTHRALAHMLNLHAQQLSLITLEYDISEDEPEDTQVFRLEPASPRTVEAIMEQLAPRLSQVDRTRIAEFSGGNARIAMALARNIQPNANLGRLTDAELFRRLFQQRNEPNDALIRAAEICALVYSFDGETLEGAEAELTILADLANMTAHELFRQVEELRRRDLVQKRSQWRAILPHAIANHLAKLALENNHRDRLMNTFWQTGQERLLRSFSRRLGYLHDSETARHIAKSWFTDPKFLGKVTQLSELGVAIFQNAAPLMPEAALVAIEDAALKEAEEFFSTEMSGRYTLIRLLRAIAYDPSLFERAAGLLARFLAAEPREYNTNSARDSFFELFHISLSGTHATAAQRLQLIRSLIKNPDQALQNVGIKALGGMLKIRFFSSSHDFAFGSRPRDFGWVPTTIDQVQAWYRSTLLYIQELIQHSCLHREAAKLLYARCFRELWDEAGINDELVALTRSISEQSGWPEGWLAVRSVLTFGDSMTSAEDIEKLRQLEIELRPADLVTKIRAYVFTDRARLLLDIADLDASSDEVDHVDAYRRADHAAEELGKSAARSPEILQLLLNELLSRSGSRLCAFGRGLAYRSKDPEATWQELVVGLEAIPEDERNLLLLRCYINGLATQRPETMQCILEDALLHPVLGPYFPVLQCAISIDERGAERLLLSLNIRRAPAYRYRDLYGDIVDGLPRPLFEQLVMGIAALDDGFDIAVDVFGMHIHSLKSKGAVLDEATLTLGQRLLMECRFYKRNTNLAYHVNEIAEQCLAGEKGRAAAMVVSRNLARALADYHSGAWDYGELAGTLFALHPWVALNVFLGGGRKWRWKPLRDRFYIGSASPVEKAQPDVLFAWARKSPKVRYPRLAQEVVFFPKNSPSEAEIGWPPIALEILEKCPDRSAVLTAFESRFHPRAWSGSLADVLMSYCTLVHQLCEHGDPKVTAWAKAMLEKLERKIRVERELDRRNDASFE